LFKDVNYYECILEEGQVLYIPVSDYFFNITKTKTKLNQFFDAISQNGGIMLNHWKQVLVLAYGFKIGRYFTCSNS
jgi:hypothetical protein